LFSQFKLTALQFFSPMKQLIIAMHLFQHHNTTLVTVLLHLTLQFPRIVFEFQFSINLTLQQINFKLIFQVAVYF
jgi:hypothetical protein